MLFVRQRVCPSICLGPCGVEEPFAVKYEYDASRDDRATQVLVGIRDKQARSMTENILRYFGSLFLPYSVPEKLSFSPSARLVGVVSRHFRPSPDL